MAQSLKCHCGRFKKESKDLREFYVCEGCDIACCDCNCLPLKHPHPKGVDTCSLCEILEKTPMQPSEKLSKSFYISSGKTLKLEIKPEISCADAVNDARAYLESEECQHSRIEFKFGHCYIVVARLKE